MGCGLWQGMGRAGGEMGKGGGEEVGVDSTVGAVLSGTHSFHP